MNNFLTKTFDNFLTKEEIYLILNYVKKTENWRKIDSNTFWNNRTINLSVIEDNNIFKIIQNIIFKLQKIIIDNYDTPSIPYPDTVDLVRWFPEMKQDPHCDDMSDHENEKSNFQHRYFGSVICLNDDYIGGKTYYPEHNFEITPKAGTLVIHLGDCNHRHGVTKVENAIRYTLASFWTFDKDRALKCINWPIE
jgi:hypothetical protein